jgi:hypothetical protein
LEVCVIPKIFGLGIQNKEEIVIDYPWLKYADVAHLLWITRQAVGKIVEKKHLVAKTFDVLGEEEKRINLKILAVFMKNDIKHLREKLERQIGIEKQISYFLLERDPKMADYKTRMLIKKCREEKREEKKKEKLRKEKMQKDISQ